MDAPEPRSEQVSTIGDYLIERLRALGVGHVFGIPGDYVLGFYDQLVASELEVITTCDEQGAGFAADAYARIRGLGVVCVTYCVGGLKVANPTAGAFAEKSPVVVISGAPGIKEREKNPLLHHKVREFDTQRKVFDQLTVASTVLSDPQTAFQEIDRVLHAALRFKRPVYIEIPRDIVTRFGIKHHAPARIHETSDPAALAEALDEAVRMINHARQPVILADVEVHRFGLQELLLALLEKTNIPFASTILGKSVMSEQHPLYLGVYEGAMGREDVRDYVESSDCVVMLGTFMTDINLGIYTARLDPARSISATSEKLSIRYHVFEDVRFKDFMRGLAAADLKHREPWRLSASGGAARVFGPAGSEADGEAGFSAAQCVPERRNDCRGRRRRCALWSGGSLHPSAHGVSGTRLLCFDGFRRARGDWGPVGESGAPSACHRGRRGLSNDRNGNCNRRPQQAQSHHRRLE